MARRSPSGTTATSGPRTPTALLFHLATGAGWPSWAPDGTKLAFAATNTGQAGPDIWVINADGSNAHPLTTTHADDDPAWSPNGTYIAFTSRRDNNNPEIYRMKADGTGQTNLTNDSGTLDSQPAFSPDSARIVFTSTKPRTGSVGPDLWTMTVTGTDLRVFTHASDNSDGSDATYSPDGKEIAFAANIGTGGLQLWAAPVAGGAESRLTGLPGNPGVSGTSWQQAPASK
jgi:Tol biopolymer transport system component